MLSAEQGCVGPADVRHVRPSWRTGSRAWRAGRRRGTLGRQRRRCSRRRAGADGV